MIQEEFAADPWKLLVATVFLNKTWGRNAIPTFRKVLERWPTPKDLMEADTDELVAMIQKLGLQSTRAIRLKELSRAYHEHPPRTGTLQLEHGKFARAPASLRERYPPELPSTCDSEADVSLALGGEAWPYPKTPISHLPGVGRYGWDSYRIFCTDNVTGTGSSDEWKRVQPSDKELCRYLTWRWAYEEGRMWASDVGPCGPVCEEWLQHQIRDELPRKA
ncbi:DNA glycosylase [Coniophora puteana RWD-64-598 SS2]|uniref:DNA glycosylase n=1 Tax=Coniophora puteana (strain RWD-64-598) TaxID=741705 RepID=R7SG25_CONPW|nr:DNA glycosylase [Coniophora puteana RWD-64-598 SS2]EIW74039.1 DNA glycosylase [Coniophora puteana RWD-64-598 SS2]